jgi:hypothetical protein
MLLLSLSLLLNPSFSFAQVVGVPSSHPDQTPSHFVFKTLINDLEHYQELNTFVSECSDQVLPQIRSRIESLHPELMPLFKLEWKFTLARPEVQYVSDGEPDGFFSEIETRTLGCSILLTVTAQSTLPSPKIVVIETDKVRTLEEATELMNKLYQDPDTLIVHWSQKMRKIFTTSLNPQTAP